ncbi:MAG: NUDIX domain-containing protein [Candidatus Aenigmarchaeota archaeon]|nr:NUDIX domain-containing protein [Candidatus Aenigmarchaeota archaeon]
MAHVLVTPAAHLVLTRGDLILLLRRFNTGWGDGNYSLVAGHLNGQETLRDAMAREAEEEAGLRLRPDDLDIVHVMHRLNNGNERIDFFLSPRQWHGEPTNKEPHKCDDMRWFPMPELPANVVPYVRHALDCIRRNVTYSEFGW